MTNVHYITGNWFKYEGESSGKSDDIHAFFAMPQTSGTCSEVYQSMVETLGYYFGDDETALDPYTSNPNWEWGLMVNPLSDARNAVAGAPAGTSQTSEDDSKQRQPELVSMPNWLIRCVIKRHLLTWIRLLHPFRNNKLPKNDPESRLFERADDSYTLRVEDEDWVYSHEAEGEDFDSE
mgnify:CR=1 FL=1